MTWNWRTDFVGDDKKRSGLGNAVSFLLNGLPPMWWIRLMLHMQSKDTRLSRFISRRIARHLMREWGIHISVLVKSVGHGVKFPHPVGIVIGDGTIIEDDVVILQNVTIGRRMTGDTGCPIIRRGAKIMAGAVIAGNITVGENATIGANAVVLADVPDNAVAAGVPAKIINKKTV